MSGQISRPGENLAAELAAVPVFAFVVTSEDVGVASESAEEREGVGEEGGGVERVHERR